MEKIAGGWSLSGIFKSHSGFPWNPLANTPAPGGGGSLYCEDCGDSTLPALYLGGAGTSTSNKAFRGPTNSNYPLGGTAYFATPLTLRTVGAPPPRMGTRFLRSCIATRSPVLGTGTST